MVASVSYNAIIALEKCTFPYNVIFQVKLGFPGSSQMDDFCVILAPSSAFKPFDNLMLDSSPPYAGFLSDRPCEGLANPTDGHGFSPGTSRFPPAVFMNKYP